MSISCGACDFGDWEFSYLPPDDFSILETKRGRRCWSCKDLIKVGDDCGRFCIQRSCRTEIEAKIYGEEADDIPMADRYMCERCVGLFFTIEDSGFCVTLPADMREEIQIAADILKNQKL